MERRRDGLVIFAISWEGLVRQGAFVRRPCDWCVSWQRVVTDTRTFVHHQVKRRRLCLACCAETSASCISNKHVQQVPVWFRTSLSRTSWFLSGTAKNVPLRVFHQPFLMRL